MLYKGKGEKMSQKFKDNIQTFGRSLLLPVAVMAPMGMLMGIASAFTQSYMIAQFPFLSNEIFQTIMVTMRTITGVIFNNIPILFAMGVAYGMSKNEKGIAVFASVVSYLTLLITMNCYLTITGSLAAPEVAAQLGQGSVLGIQTLRIEVMGGIIAGLVGAMVCNRFYKLELPLAFAFFGGKKSVPIIAILVTVPIGFVVPIIWALFTQFLISISFIFTTDYIGTGIYWVLNRALIPFGLHHVLASVVRYTEAGGIYIVQGAEYVGVLNATNQILFQAGPADPSWSAYMPKLTSYLGGGQMLTTLFRVPAIGLAMYHTAYKKNKKIARGVILTCVLTAFLGNITEPLEFSFLFISPQLFILYCLLCGLGSIPYQMLGISIGYIRGTIFDFTVFGLMFDNTNWIFLVLLGIANFIMFYFVFKWYINKFNLETPGRESFELNESGSALLKDKNYVEMARITIEALGGAANMLSVANCISRLRVDLKDASLVDETKLRESGCMGVFFPSENHIHVVFGAHVEFVKNAVDEQLGGKKK